MADEPAYLIAEPFQQSLGSLRRALSTRHLNVAGGFDISERIRGKLFIGTTPCMVLFGWPSHPLEAPLEPDRRAAALAPFHIVVSKRGRQTEIHVVRTLTGDRGLIEPHFIAALNEAHSEILRAIESIGMPAGSGV